MPTHTHKYKRVDIGRDKPYIVYQCQLNCSHYLTPVLIIGKQCVCWRQGPNCLKEFELKKSNLKVKPTCANCKKIQETAKEKKETDAVFKSLGF
jgi:hypothetical protein